MRWWALCLWGVAMLGQAADLDAQLERALQSDRPVSRVVAELLDQGHDPQAVAQELLARLPWEAPTVAATLAVRDPAAAPSITAAVAAMALADPALVAAAVVAEVPALAPEVAASAGRLLPSRAVAVVEAVARSAPGSTPEVCAAVVGDLPEEALSVARFCIALLADTAQGQSDALLAVLAKRLGEVSADSRLAEALLAEVGPVETRIRLLGEFWAGAPEMALAPRVLDRQGGVRREDAKGLAIGESLPMDQRLSLDAGAEFTVLTAHGVCAVLGPGSLHWTAIPRLERGGLRCAGMGLTLAWPDGEIQAAEADLLLVVGTRGAGLLVFRGGVDLTGGETLGVGLHLLDGNEPRPVDFTAWLAGVGLDSRALGDLGEPVVWIAEHLRGFLTPR